MKILASLVLILSLAAFGEHVKPDVTAAPIAAPLVQNVTNTDVRQMIYCGSYLIMISKDVTHLEMASFNQRLAQGWLRTAMFYAAAIEYDYVALLNSGVIDAKMASENLMGAVGVEGMITSFYKQCSDLMPITEEYVEFWELHGNV